MANTLQQAYDQSQGAQFQQRVQIAACNAAVAVQSEAANTLLSADAAAAATTITPVSVANFATNDLVQIGTGANAETRKITVSGANFTVSAMTNAHKAGELIQKVLYNHTNRANYAKLILNNPAGYAVLFATTILANDLANMSDQAADSAIQTAVNSVINALAGTI